MPTQTASPHALSSESPSSMLGCEILHILGSKKLLSFSFVPVSLLLTGSWPGNCQAAVAVSDEKYTGKDGSVEHGNETNIYLIILGSPGLDQDDHHQPDVDGLYARRPMGPHHLIQ